MEAHSAIADQNVVYLLKVEVNVVVMVCVMSLMFFRFFLLLCQRPCTVAFLRLLQLEALLIPTSLLSRSVRSSACCAFL